MLIDTMSWILQPVSIYKAMEILTFNFLANWRADGTTDMSEQCSDITYNLSRRTCRGAIFSYVHAICYKWHTKTTPPQL